LQISAQAEIDQRQQSAKGNVPGLDLFTPVVDASRFHPNFRNFLGDSEKYVRDVLQQWAEGFMDRDGKFVQEFQTSFNSCFWELYLFACLKHLDLPVDLSFGAPDFVVTAFWNEFSIEASIASNADDEPAEWERDLRKLKNLDRERVLDEATVRLANTLVQKHSKFLQSSSKHRHVADKPFVVAIAPFEQPFFEVQNDQAMRRVLYTYDRPLPKSQRTRQPSKAHHVYIEKIRKRNGTEIDLGFFLTKRMPEISAVIFSNTATAGKLRALSKDPNPHIWFRTLRFNKFGDEAFMWGVAKPDYFESLLDGLHVFHNPHAYHRLSPSLFDRQGVTQHFYVEGHPWPPFMATHGALIQRTVVTMRVKK